MTNQELFKQAIADAKAVRDAAVANAKSALEETFTPKIMAMLSTKLNELEEDSNLEEKEEKTEEGYYEEGHEASIGYGAASQKPSIEETDLEEILAQLSEDDDADDVNEAKEKEEEGKKVEEAKKKDDKEKVEESLDEAEGSDEVTELTVDELKDMIRDVMKDVMGGGEEAGEEAGEDEEIDLGDGESKEDEDKTLDELLSELMAESKDKKEKEAKDKKAKKEKVEESVDEEDVKESKFQAAVDLFGGNSAETTFLLGLGTVGAVVAGAMLAPKAASVISGLWSKLTGSQKTKLAKAASEAGIEVPNDSTPGSSAENPAYVAEKKAPESKDLEEAIKTINVLRDELNEVNLLNAKLLYTNKIFKAKSLSESQKVNVLKAFDKANNVKEAKLVYESLTESLNAKTKSTIKESVGFASKAAGVAPKQPIVEGDSAIRRMQQLAGIIK